MYVFNVRIEVTDLSMINPLLKEIIEQNSMVDYPAGNHGLTEIPEIKEGFAEWTSLFHPQAQAVEQETMDDSDLPGMWEKSDFTGGETDN